MLAMAPSMGYRKKSDNFPDTFCLIKKNHYFFFNWNLLVFFRGNNWEVANDILIIGERINVTEAENRTLLESTVFPSDCRKGYQIKSRQNDSQTEAGGIYRTYTVSWIIKSDLERQRQFGTTGQHQRIFTSACMICFLTKSYQYMAVIKARTKKTTTNRTDTIECNWTEHHRKNYFRNETNVLIQNIVRNP